MKKIVSIAVCMLLVSGCVLLPPSNRRFCKEVERLGWFDNVYLQALGRRTFAPDPYYPANPWNPDFRPTPMPTVNCYCYSKVRKEVLAVCPADPWTPRGEEIPAWHRYSAGNSHSFRVIAFPSTRETSKHAMTSSSSAAEAGK